MSVAARFLSNKPLKQFSTFGIGGPARLFTQVDTVEEMQETLSFCHQEKIPFFILGKGSNCLFHDRGFDGLVIHNKIAFLSINEQKVSVGAGYSFALLGVQTAKKGLCGLEFAAGIPASVGGAIFMNAGAGKEETSTYLQEIDFVTKTGELLSFSKRDLVFSYRHSSFQDMSGAIVAARFVLELDTQARDRQLAIINYRTKTQPYGDLSIGCFFKNPPGTSAGALIEKAGLKGFQIGGAEVSCKHANFIINRSQATAEDVLALGKEVRRRVLETTGVELEFEARCIPYQSFS